MELNITEEQFKKFENLNFDRLKDNKSGTIVSPLSLTKDDKLYVFPTCKIKKLPMRKYIKEIGVKQVHKPEDATVIIVNPGLISTDNEWYGNSINVNRKYVIPPGRYMYNHDSSRVCIDTSEPKHFTKDSMLRFIFNTQFKTGSYSYYSDHANQCSKKLENYERVFDANIGNKSLNEEHIKVFFKDDIKIINQDDMQQTVYDWEVDNKVREDTTEYNWEAVQDLLMSDEMWEIAIQMIYKLDFNKIQSNLVACFYSHKICTDAKRAILDKIFIRNPRLTECIDRNHASYGSYYDGYIHNFLESCSQNNVKIDLDTFKLVGLKVFKERDWRGNKRWKVREI